MLAIDLGLFQSPPLLSDLHNIVTVVHAIPDHESFQYLSRSGFDQCRRTHSGSMVSSLAEGFGQHYGVGTQVRVGDSLMILTGLAHQARLLVIGLHRRPGFARFLLDSISHAPLHASPRFVLAVR